MNGMKQKRLFTAIIEREGDGYVSLCPELDIASQGDTVEEARSNLAEALELFFEVANPSEISLSTGQKPKNKGSNRFLDFCPVHRKLAVDCTARSS
jgi:predicted RNase H-like HicB family nuclease